VIPNAFRKILLLLDGHSTHTTNIEARQLARDSSVVVSLTGHATHSLQQLHVAFFRPFLSRRIWKVVTSQSWAMRRSGKGGKDFS